MEREDQVERIRANAHWHTERRDKMAADGLRALLILNGGASVALLAFLQSVWDKPSARSMIPWILGGMIPLLVGAALAAGVHFARYHTSMAYQMEGKNAGRKMTLLHDVLTGIGFACFLVGIATVIAGGFLNLPKQPLQGVERTARPAPQGPAKGP